MACFSDLVMGIGLLTDHGFDYSIHGRVRHQIARDTQLVGSGGMLWRFRNTYLTRAGLIADTQASRSLLVVSRAQGPPRKRYNLHRVADRVQQKLHLHTMSDVDMAELSMVEQMRLVRDSTVMISQTGGGSMISMFLPRGATLVLVGTEFLDSAYHTNMAHYHTRFVKAKFSDDTGVYMLLTSDCTDRIVHLVERALTPV